MTSKLEKKELKKKSTNISDWYNDVVLKAELADYGPAKGTMVIRPYGFAIWERVQQIFNKWIKAYGVENAYFPLFIPHSLLEKEKSHVKGFSPELAIVTHGGGKKLAEPLVIRPTSETIMYEMYSKWIKSWKDLPMMINQWNNVVRWEKRTYLFLRTTEFLWQEGHTAHTTEAEAIEMQNAALTWYQKIYQEYYAIPVLAGVKSDSETFAGAKTTYAVEALMPDGKALQGATSHNLGQNFSKAFDISFQAKNDKNQLAWQTSWGLSTRSLGGLFLVHGDDHGLKLPPKIAPIQVVIIPVNTNSASINQYVDSIITELKKENIRVKVDRRQGQSLGRKINHWELKGVPIRVEIGDKEVEKNHVTIVRRDSSQKTQVQKEELTKKISNLLTQIQKNLYQTAQKHLEKNTHQVSDYKKFKKIMASSRGFIIAHWCEDESCEAKIKQQTKATTRLKLLNQKNQKDGKCIYCNKPGTPWYFAQAY